MGTVLFAHNQIHHKKYPGQIYLYGEEHSVEKILQKEIELWQSHYENGIRDLFLELPYYTAEYLNIYLKEKDDKILKEIFDDWKGTAFYSKEMFNFFVEIKNLCPQTIFHGFDVGHQYKTTGKRFIIYLENSGQKDSDKYLQTKKILEQGIIYYGKSGTEKAAYRENKMAENFLYELSTLTDTSCRSKRNVGIIAICGSAHIKNKTACVHTPCMEAQLKLVYGNNLHSEDMRTLIEETGNIPTEKIQIGEKTYTAFYYGKQNLIGFKDYLYREFWQLENAYSDFKNKPKTGDVLPHDNYPMEVKPKQVFVIDYVKTDKTRQRLYYISDGTLWNGRPSTENIQP